MDLGSMSDGELRRAHAMFVANPDAFLENPEYMHALVREYTRRFSPGNVEADLDAAATPMPAEPVLQPGRKRSRADWAVDAVTAGGLYSPSENVDSMDVGDKPPARSVAAAARARGETPPGYDEWSEGMAQASGDLPKAQRVATGEAMINRWDRQADAYNRDTGLTSPDTSIADEGGPYPGAGRPGYDRTFTPDELLAQQSQAEADRQAQWAEERNAAIGAKYGPQARKAAEAADARGEIDFSAVQSPREKEMNRYRESIERSARFDPDTEKRENSRELRGELERSRSEDRKKFRAQVASAPKSPVDPRMERWKAQSMLAGGQPTGGPRGTKAVTNAWYALGDEGLNDWQRLTMAKALRPDIDGTSPLTVDANSAKNAMRLLNAEVLGQGMMGDARAQMLQQQNRVAADEMAQREAGKLLGWGKRSLTRQEAERIRRRIENVYPGMGGVIEGLPIEDDGAAPAPVTAGQPPAGYPGAAPSPPPRNPLAAPRPYG